MEDLRVGMKKPVVNERQGKLNIDEGDSEVSSDHNATMSEYKKSESSVRMREDRSPYAMKPQEDLDESELTDNDESEELDDSRARQNQEVLNELLGI